MHVSTPSSKRTKETTAVRMCALACARAAMSCVVRPPVRPLDREGSCQHLCGLAYWHRLPPFKTLQGPHDGAKGADYCS